MGEIYDQIIEFAIKFIVVVGTNPALKKFFNFDIVVFSVKSFLYIFQTIQRLFGYKKIILYTDCSDHSATNKCIAEHLLKNFSQKKFKIKIIENPEAILKEPLSQSITHAIIILITNVSGLSANDRKKQKIQESINYFCQSGGIVVLGHDAIYRRTKNQIFEKMTGGVLNHYNNNNKEIIYSKNNAGSRRTTDESLLNSLPQSMKLTDGEFLLGSWAQDVEFLYVLGGKREEEIDKRQDQTPLVTRKTNGRGTAYWINSGDFGESGPPRSLSAPENGFIEILKCILLNRKN